MLLTVHLITIFVKRNQLDAQFFFLYMFISILYMFRATKCSSSEESIVSIRPLVYVTLSKPAYHTGTYIVTYSRGRIDTIDSPDDERLFARNVYRTGINKLRKRIVRQVGYLQRQHYVILIYIVLTKLLKFCTTDITIYVCLQ